MTNRISRKQQLVRLRGCEHRRTQARLAQAQSDLSRLIDLSARLDRLRRELAVSEHQAVGSDFRMVGEMADRLDLARAALEQPVQAAADLHAMLARDTGIAAAREDAATRQLALEEQQAASAAEHFRDANRIHRPAGMRLRLIAGGAQ
ncbi:MAG: hypothetical protein SFV20_01005 [Sphingopyxis sp.]|nr:hypothetical protein [Sphingopyxis sp.]